jgi:hypothetical protein
VETDLHPEIRRSLHDKVFVPVVASEVSGAEINVVGGGVVSGPVEVVLILAAVGYVLVRRVMGEPAQGKRMLILPAVLVVIGLSDVSGDAQTAVPLLFLVVTGGISVLLGGLRGLSVRLSERDGLAFVNYTGVTVALWVANLVIKFGGNFILAAVDRHDAAAVSNSLFLTLGAGMLAEGLVVLARALRTDGRIIWAQGEDGAPHTMSPFLDGLQSRATGGTSAGRGGSLAPERDAARQRRFDAPGEERR